MCHLAFLALVSCKSSEIEGELVALWVGGSCLYVLLQHLVIREPELVGLLNQRTLGGAR